MNPKVQLFFDHFKTNDFFVSKLFSDMSDDDLSNRPSGTANSAHFIFGHIMFYRADICKFMGIDTGIDYKNIFGRGADIKDTSEYPPMEQLCKEWTKVSEKMYDALKKLTDEKVNEPMEHPFPFRDKTFGGALSFLIYHETYHIGQLTYNRRVNGLSNLIG